MPRQRNELGAVGLPITNGFLTLDPNRLLTGAKGITTYRTMLHDEPAAVAGMNAITTLFGTDLQVEAGGSTDADKRAQEFVETCLDDMRLSLGTYMRQAQGFLPYGWAALEMVFKRRNGGKGSRYTDGRVGWAHWGLRRQETLYKWQDPGNNGQVTGLIQRPPPTYDLRTIPLWKCIHLVADDSEGSPEGRSILRGMYRLWFITKNLELLMGIALERFGTGVPVFKVSPEMTSRLSEADQELMQGMLEGLRQNEAAGIITPGGVDFGFASSPGLSVKDYLAVIQYFRTVMLSTVLADFISLGTNSGSYALGKDKTELFLLSLNSYQDRMTDAITRQAVARLFLYNDFGTLTDLPRVTLPAIKRYELDKLGAFVQILDRIGGLHITPADEELFRRMADLVKIDPATLEELHEADDTAAEEDEPPPEQGDAATGDGGDEVLPMDDEGAMEEDEELVGEEA